MVGGLGWADNIRAAEVRLFTREKSHESHPEDLRSVCQEFNEAVVTKGLREERAED